MQISTRNLGTVTILDIAGEIDLYNAVDLEMTIRKLIKENKVRVVINLAQVPFIDSNGLAKLLFTQRELQKVSGMLKLLSLTPNIRKLFEATKLNTKFEIFESEEDALMAFPP